MDEDSARARLGHELRRLRKEADLTQAALAVRRHSTDALRRVGFGSRWAIHPAQVPVINQAFTPAPEQVEAARRLVERYEAALDQDVGVVVDEDGRMVDQAVVRAARRALARADPATKQ